MSRRQTVGLRVEVMPEDKVKLLKLGRHFTCFGMRGEVNLSQTVRVLIRQAYSSTKDQMALEQTS